ncbi:MAG: metallophosphoesterase [Terracidiphilus sp.]
MSNSPSNHPITRRRFLAAAACAGAGLALYAGEIERHRIEITRRDVPIPGLPKAFDGFRAVQLSDIHMDGFTEPFFLRDAVKRIDALNPDAVFLTGDFVTHEFLPRRFSFGAAWQCANILNELRCPHRYAVLGNHDVTVGAKRVTSALTANSITVLTNSYLPVERAGSRFWLAGLDDPVVGKPNPDAAIPASICNLPGEPIILLCHAPDYVDKLLTLPAGKAVSLVLAGHSHGGQIRLPFIGPLILPPLGRKYVEGSFRFGSTQLYVNRGLGAVGVPFRLDCPPEITLHTLRSA